jgi:hypothetical protein
MSMSPTGPSSGTMTDAVFRNGSGTLDLAYQITVSVNAPVPVIRKADASFLGYLTDVDVLANGSVLPAGVFGDGSHIEVSAGESQRMMSGDGSVCGQSSTACGKLGPRAISTDELSGFNSLGRLPLCNALISARACGKPVEKGLPRVRNPSCLFTI